MQRYHGALHLFEESLVVGVGHVADREHPEQDGADEERRSGAGSHTQVHARSRRAVRRREADVGDADANAGDQTASILPVRTMEDAVQDYLELGAQDERVLGEVPQRVLLDSRALDARQGYEVIYIRQFVERAVVDDLMRFQRTTDEFGRPVVTPATWPPAQRMGFDG